MGTGPTSNDATTHQVLDIFTYGHVSPSFGSILLLSTGKLYEDPPLALRP